MFHQDTATRTDSVSLSQQRLMYEQYLRGVVELPANRQCPKLLELLQVSLTTFDARQGPSFREGYVSAHWASMQTDEGPSDVHLDEAPGPSMGDQAKGMVLKAFRPSGGRRWAVLKNSFLALYKSRHDSRPDAVLLFDTGTALQASLFNTGRMVVSNASWRFEIKTDSALDQRLWWAAVQSALGRAPWVERDRFNYHRWLSAGMLDDTTSATAQWFVDGDAVYKTFHAAIMGAKSEVFISGLWVSPDLFLLRPAHRHPTSRLDKVLEAKAQEGVQVYILMFREGQGGLTINSKYSKRRFQALRHQGNIHVLRAGDERFPGAWVHGDLVLCVDQQLAFVGSQGLGLGKYDTAAHKLRDHGVRAKDGSHAGAGKPVWPGRDYWNPLVKDFTGMELQNTDTDLPGIQRSCTPRMPVHGVSAVVTGFPATDVCWHFITRWNVARHRYGREGHVPALRPLGLWALDLGPSAGSGSGMGVGDPLANEGYYSGDEGTQPPIDPSESSSVRRTTGRLLFGASSSASTAPDPRPHAHGASDNVQQAAQDKLKEALTTRREKARQRLHELQHEMEDDNADLLFQSLVEDPYMPRPGPMATNNTQHAIAGASTPVWGVRSPNVQPPGSVNSNKSRFSKRAYLPSGWDVPELGPTPFADSLLASEEVKDADLNAEAHPANSHTRAMQEADAEHRAEVEAASIGPLVHCRCRVVRSIGSWAGTRKDNQASIADAYEHMIGTAQHFVYMETPCFVSGLRGDTSVTNRVAEAILNRIVKAHFEGKRFRAILLLPLLPVFEGALQGAATSALTGALYWQLRSLTAMRERLSALVHDPDEYLQIFGLRGFSQMSAAAPGSDSTWASEQILVDSRLLIVDDRACIIGSAPINERSLSGGRDTHVAVVLEDASRTTSSLMDGKAFSAGELCRSLRLRLWAEHLGLAPNDDRLVDPISPKTWDLLQRTAQVNTALLGHVFPDSLPSDSVRTLSDLKNVRTGQAPAHAEADVVRVLGDDACQGLCNDSGRGSWLSQVRGHLVTYPTHFLSHDHPHLRPVPALEQLSM